MKCARCHRPLKREPIRIADMCLGPRCAAAMFGAKEKRTAAVPVKRDERTRDLFEAAA